MNNSFLAEYQHLIDREIGTEALTRAIPPDVNFEDCNFREPEWCPAIGFGVRDGDTLLALVITNSELLSVAAFWIRLYGINSPEMKSKDPAEKARAHEAKAFLHERTFLKGLIVYLPGVKKRSFDRLLGFAWEADGTNLSHLMVEQGLAEWKDY